VLLKNAYTYNLVPRAFPLKVGGAEKDPGIGWSRVHLKNTKTLSVLSRLGYAFNRCIKPLQVKCFEYLLKGKDIVAVLPTGFGKSLLLTRERISNP